MAVDSPNDQELALKKRARRRLVGAIALVILMVILLPRILQDRVALAPQEAIKITMPEVTAKQEVTSADDSKASMPEAAVTKGPAAADLLAESENLEVSPEETVSDANSVVEDRQAKVEDKKTQVKKPDVSKSEAIKSNKEKVATPKPNEAVANDAKIPPNKAESFTIQVGVFSDLANVKQLQARLKQLGLDSRTENITTPKGEKIRLRAGRFASRQDAAYALTKLQSENLTGMVISNN